MPVDNHAVNHRIRNVRPWSRMSHCQRGHRCTNRVYNQANQVGAWLKCPKYLNDRVNRGLIMAGAGYSGPDFLHQSHIGRRSDRGTASQHQKNYGEKFSHALAFGSTGYWPPRFWCGVGPCSASRGLKTSPTIGPCGGCWKMSPAGFPVMVPGILCSFLGFLSSILDIPALEDGTGCKRAVPCPASTRPASGNPSGGNGGRPRSFQPAGTVPPAVVSVPPPPTVVSVGAASVLSMTA